PPITWKPSWCMVGSLAVQTMLPPSIARSCTPSVAFTASPAAVSASRWRIRPVHPGCRWIASAPRLEAIAEVIVTETESRSTGPRHTHVWSVCAIEPVSTPRPCAPPPCAGTASAAKSSMGRADASCVAARKRATATGMRAVRANTQSLHRRARRAAPPSTQGCPDAGKLDWPPMLGESPEQGTGQRRRARDSGQRGVEAGMRTRRMGKRWLALAVLVVAAVATTVAYADTVSGDGDIVAQNNRLQYGPGGFQEPCSGRGVPVAGAVTVTFNGTRHFDSGSMLT